MHPQLSTVEQTQQTIPAAELRRGDLISLRLVQWLGLHRIQPPRKWEARAAAAPRAIALVGWTGQGGAGSDTTGLDSAGGVLVLDFAAEAAPALAVGVLVFRAVIMQIASNVGLGKWF